MNSLPYSGHLIDGLTELVDSKFSSGGLRAEGSRPDGLEGVGLAVCSQSDPLAIQARELKGASQDESQVPELEEFECGDCGAITKATTWQQAMDLHNCPAYDERDSAHSIQQQIIAEGLR